MARQQDRLTARGRGGGCFLRAIRGCGRDGGTTLLVQLGRQPQIGVLRVARPSSTIGVVGGRALFRGVRAEQVRQSEIRANIAPFIAQTAFAGRPATYKDVKETLFEAFSLPANEEPSSP